MEKKSTKVLEDRNLRKYADHHLNLFHLKFFKKQEKIQKARGPARAFPGRVGSGSGRAFFGPARDQPGPEKPGLVSGRGL